MEFLSQRLTDNQRERDARRAFISIAPDNFGFSDPRRDYGFDYYREADQDDRYREEAIETYNLGYGTKWLKEETTRVNRDKLAKQLARYEQRRTVEGVRDAHGIDDGEHQLSEKWRNTYIRDAATHDHLEEQRRKLLDQVRWSVGYFMSMNGGKIPDNIKVQSPIGDITYDKHAIEYEMAQDFAITKNMISKKVDKFSIDDISASMVHTKHDTGADQNMYFDSYDDSFMGISKHTTQEHEYAQMFGTVQHDDVRTDINKFDGFDYKETDEYTVRPHTGLNKYSGESLADYVGGPGSSYIMEQPIIEYKPK